MSARVTSGLSMEESDDESSDTRKLSLQRMGVSAYDEMQDETAASNGGEYISPDKLEDREAFVTDYSKAENTIPRYKSFQLGMWTLFGAFGALLFSSMGLMCAAYEHNNYCEHPLLKNPPMVVTFLLTLIVVLLCVGFHNYYLHMCYYRPAKEAMLHLNDLVLSKHNPDLRDNFEQLSRWYLHFIVGGSTYLFLSNYVITMIASFYKGNSRAVFAVLEFENLGWGLKYEAGIILLEFYYLPLFIVIYSGLIYTRICQSIITISENQASFHPTSMAGWLIEFRHSMFDLRYFLAIILYFGTSLMFFGMVWNTSVIIGVIFGGKNRGFLGWGIMIAIVGVFATVSYGLCSIRIGRTSRYIYQKVCMDHIPMFAHLPFGNPDETDTDTDDAARQNVNVSVQNADEPLLDTDDVDSPPVSAPNRILKLSQFWWKQENKIVNIHGAICLLTLVIYFNELLKKNVDKYQGGALTLCVLAIMQTSAALLLQCFTENFQSRTNIFGKTFFFALLVFFIRRSHQIKTAAEKSSVKNTFGAFTAVFILLAIVTLLLICTMAFTKFLFVTQVSKAQEQRMQRIFPGKLKIAGVLIPKWRMCQVSYVLSWVNTFGLSLVLIGMAGSSSSHRWDILQLFYPMLWLVFTFVWQNEFVQYCELNLMDIKDRAVRYDHAKKYSASLTVIQLFLPIVAATCIADFAYTVKYAGHAGIFFSCVQMFAVLPCAVVGTWHV